MKNKDLYMKPEKWLKEMENWVSGQRPEGLKISDFPKNGIFPQKLSSITKHFEKFPDKKFEQDLGLYYLRLSFIENFGFFVPDIDSLKTIASFSPILEIASGSGYLSKILSDLGADVIATDPNLGSKPYTTKIGKYFRTEKLDAISAIKKYPNRTILLSWPTNEKWSEELLTKIKKESIFILIAEGNGGCNGSDEFYKFLKKNYSFVERLQNKKFPGIYDNISILKSNVNISNNLHVSHKNKNNKSKPKKFKTNKVSL